VAEIVTDVLLATVLVVIENAGEILAPPGMEMDAGTLVLGSLLESVTVTPLGGAGPSSITLF
jgi:hypothetical protein